MAHIVAAAMSQYMLQISAVDTKNFHLPSILIQLENPCMMPVISPHILMQKLLLFLKNHKKYIPPAAQTASIATIHHMLKSSLSDSGSHIWVMKKPPNFSHLADRSTTISRSIESISQPLSSTTVPSTLSYEAFFLIWPDVSPSSGIERLVTTPQRTNSPIRGNTKFAIYPILTALKVVIRLVEGSIGSRSCLQRKPLNQNAAIPAAIERTMNSQRHVRRPAIKSFHSTSRNEK